MCGIVGVVNFDDEPASAVQVKNMTDAIVHRGPDDEGQFIFENVGLGHRRLSIIDLSPAAHQPMQSADMRYVLTYNGEIYNFRELRSELEALGYQFRSNSDSEVVLYAYMQWQEKCVERFNGMFAFAILDKFEKTLFLARDRYGIKPLYYAFSGPQFFFGSEQKGIQAYHSFESQLDYKALLEYFTFQNLFTDRTFDDKIKLFPAGHWARLSIKNPVNKLSLHQYWDFNFEEPENPDTEEAYIEELDRLFRQAVKRQLVSDVELGSYLSGGMDSGSITAIAASELPYIKTFTCGFDMNSAQGIELGFDEREKSEYMSYQFKTEHYEMVLKAGDMERCIPKLAYHLEEPRVGQCYPNFYAAQLASKFVKVCLSGVGGDELFGGYPWRYYRVSDSQSFTDYIDKYYLYWQRLVDNKDLKRLFAPVWNHVKDVWTRDIFEHVFINHKNKLENPIDYINHSLYFEAKTFLQGLLVVEDKVSMAHSLETRVPFLDNELVDFSMKIPMKYKLRNLGPPVQVNENNPGDKQNQHFKKTNDGKLILREVMKTYIPERISSAVKQGFSAPDSSWFKGESIDFVKKTLLNQNNPLYSILDFDTANEIINIHINGKENKRLFIWSLLNINELSKEEKCLIRNPF